MILVLLMSDLYVLILTVPGKIGLTVISLHNGSSSTQRWPLKRVYKLFKCVYTGKLETYLKFGGQSFRPILARGCMIKIFRGAWWWMGRELQ